MAHTIFHSPDRDEIIRQRTPVATREQALERRRTARRTILEGLGTLTPSTPTGSQTGSQGRTGGPIGGDGTGAGDLGGAGDIDSFGRSPAIDVSFSEALAAATLSTNPTITALGQLGGLVAGPLGTVVGGLAGFSIAQSQPGFNFANPLTGNLTTNFFGNTQTFAGAGQSFGPQSQAFDPSDGTPEGSFGTQSEVDAAAAFSDFADNDLGMDVTDSSGTFGGFGDTGGIGADTNGDGSEGGPSGGTGGPGEGGGIGL